MVAVHGGELEFAKIHGNALFQLVDAAHVQTHFLHFLIGGHIRVDLRFAALHEAFDAVAVEVVAVLVGDQQNVQIDLARREQRGIDALEAGILQRAQHKIGKIGVDGDGLSGCGLEHEARLSEPEKLHMTGVHLGRVVLLDKVVHDVFLLYLK